jgi:copper/silver efflux system protein
LNLIGLNNIFEDRWLPEKRKYVNQINIALTLIVVIFYLTKIWMPLGAQNSFVVNFLFSIAIVGIILGTLMTIVHFYPEILKWCLRHKWKFLVIPMTVVLFGIMIWMGFGKLFGFMPGSLKETDFWRSAEARFPGVGKEFMPALDEGSFLLMPTTMPHSGIEENLDVIALLDKRVNSVPEVESVVGKWGRVNSALDPAPTSMYENVINYKSEYILNEDGHRMRFKVNKNDAFILKDGSTYNSKTDGVRLISKEDLVVDKNGEYFRQWRDNIHSPILIRCFTKALKCLVCMVKQPELLWAFSPSHTNDRFHQPVCIPSSYLRFSLSGA